MEATSNSVGAVARPLVKEITWRHAMNFAAATGDANPMYLDDVREGGIIVPPLLSVALTWPFGERAEEFWFPDEFPLHLLVHQVHYTEQIEFHRTMKPGDVITIKAEVATIQPHRGGTYFVIKFRAFNQDEQPVFTEYAGAILRNVKLLDKGAGLDAVPPTPRFHPDGGPLWENHQHVNPLAAHIYDGCADIYNPIHTSRQFAKQVGLPDSIICGTCTLSWAIRDVVNAEGNADPTRLKRLGCRFTGMVFPGSDVTIRLLGKTEQEDSTTSFFEVRNQDGKRAISDGFVVLANA
jgi:acyl dehydratase